MFRHILTIFVCLCFSMLSAQITITEIMYNPPESGTDSLEFIEIYNAGSQDVDLEGYTFTQGIVFTFPSYVLLAGDYAVVCVDTLALENVFGVSESFQWTSGGLSNGGEDIIIEDAQGNQVDVVDYQNGGEWPAAANGEGSSLELCDVSRDNNAGQNWKASLNAKGLIINGYELKASPMEDNNASCADHVIIVKNNVFEPDSLIINVGETVEWMSIEGIHNVNGNTATFPSNPESFGNGSATAAPWTYSHTFTLEGSYDYQCDPHALVNMKGYIRVVDNQLPNLMFTEVMYNNPGVDTLEFIEIYNNEDAEVDLTGYSFINGIDLAFDGEVIPAKGFLVVAAYPDFLMEQLGVPSIQFVGSLNNGGEALELVDDQGRTVDRIVYDNASPWPVDADGQGYSMVLCDINTDNGQGGQWGISTHQTGLVIEGVEVYCNPGAKDECAVVENQYPEYDIARVTTVDGFGIPDSIQVQCALQGIVHGVDLQGNANINFTLIDPTGGISIFSDDNFNYTVQEGDELLVKGQIGHFNGLTQMYLDSLRVLDTGLTPYSPVDVTVLDEDTESEMVRITNVTLVDPSEWSSGGSGFNVQVTDGTHTFDVRIDDDVDLFQQQAPTGRFNLTGIGGQYDTSEPYTDGYQLLPRYMEDLEPLNSNVDQLLRNTSIVPNPVSSMLMVDGLPGYQDAEYRIVDQQGQVLFGGVERYISVDFLSSGMYILEIRIQGSRHFLRFVKQ